MPILNIHINKNAHFNVILTKLNTDRADELEAAKDESATPAK